MTDADESDDTYLYIVSYDDDAERKRVEYLFNNRGGDIDTPDGLVRIADGVDHEDLYEQLVSKVRPEQVSAYRLESVETDIVPETVVVEESIPATIEAVETFLEYVLSKRKAVLQSATHNEYELYTKKGRAEVTYRLSEREEAVDVEIRIEGYPPAPAFLAEFFENELRDYASSQTNSQP